ncbi:unnamed protein product, partial [Linum tenue]
ALLWTINDFPAYANLSGWSTKGALACPSCNKETHSVRLKKGCKFSYMGARRFLPSDHKWRDNKCSFDGKVEKRSPPTQLFGDQVLKQHEGLVFDEFGKGKTKDGLNARRDLEHMKIRRKLHPVEEDGKWKLPPACYSLLKEEKKRLCTFLKKVKVPDGVFSNISNCVRLKDRKIFGLKSHDSHIILERLLPLALRGIVRPSVYDAITELCIYFRELCSRELSVDVLKHLESS